MKRTAFYVQLLILAAWCLGPFLWALCTSLKPDPELTRLPPLLPHPPIAAHYISVFKEYPFARIILNSLMVATATTLLALAIGSLAAFSLGQLALKGRGLILACVLSVSMFPPIATVAPLYLIIQKLGLRDNPIALILTYTTFSLPLAIWVLTHFFRNLSPELYLAARVDGCTAFQAFRRVLLPLSAPGLVATGLLVFIFSWNEFLYALTFTATVHSRTVPVAIAMFPGLHEMPWGEIAAASVVVTLPIAVLAFAFQRRIVEGLTAGSVKG